MAVTVAVPADAMGGRHSFGHDQLPAGAALVLLEA
jgi:hypothetical protein